MTLLRSIKAMKPPITLEKHELRALHEILWERMEKLEKNIKKNETGHFADIKNYVTYDIFKKVDDAIKQGEGV